MKSTQHWAGVGIALAAALMLGGCAADESPEPTSAPETPPQATTTPDNQTSGGTDDLATPISVEATGDGPVGLAAIDPLPNALDDATSVTARLITATGGCFALKQNDRPDLVVFGEGAEFTFEGERPSLEDPVAGTVQVDERADLTVATVPISDVGGIPERCLSGASDEVIVVLR